MKFEHLLDDQLVQIYGVRIIEDKQFVELELVRQIYAVAKRWIKLVVDMMPMRVKNVYFVNKPMIFDMLVGLIRPLMK